MTFLQNILLNFRKMFRKRRQKTKNFKTNITGEKLGFHTRNKNISPYEMPARSQFLLEIETKPKKVYIF